MFKKRESSPRKKTYWYLGKEFSHIAKREINSKRYTFPANGMMTKPLKSQGFSSTLKATMITTKCKSNKPNYFKEKGVLLLWSCYSTAVLQDPLATEWSPRVLLGMYEIVCSVH